VSGLRRLTTAAVCDLAAMVRPRAQTAPGRDDADRLVDAFARGVWSGLAEPGDAAAGVVRRVLGPSESLRLALESLEARRGDADTGGGALRAALAAADPDEAPRVSIGAALSRWQPRAVVGRVTASFRAAAALGVRLVVPGDAEWPTALDELGDHAPPALWLRGPATVPEVARSIAVVGARAATAYGEQVAADLASGLCDRGFVVVSGGAYGIDGMAHRAALASEGDTVAVMAGGPDRLYPAGHDALLRRVVERGLLLAESPCGTAPARWRFLQRNRLIAALTAATVVVEAGRRSGSLNTAGHAQVLGRPVGTVPGPVSSPSSAGCHALIRAGLATCVTDADEVVELVRPATLAVPAPLVVDEGSTDAVRVLDALSTRVERSTEEVAATAGLGLSTVRSTLVELESDGAVSRGDVGWRKRPRRR